MKGITIIIINMNIFLPEQIKKIIKIFEDNNFKCYVVGGALRDILLNLTPNEFDICTNALPCNIKSLFKKVITIGEAYGCIKIFFENTWFEITTFRIENNYTDFRHAKFIKFINSPKLDALRRDFTINSLYFNGKSLIDPFNGIEDLNKKIIRLIGNKNLKFYEDPLRILRALKFKSKLNFKIEFLTLLSLKNNFYLIKHLSKYRIHEELHKIFENLYSYDSIKIFSILNGFQIILNSKFKIFNFEKILNLTNKFHIKLFCILYFHSDIDKLLIPDILKNHLNFNKTDLYEINLIFKILQENLFENNKGFIKFLIFNYDYNFTFFILNVINTYIPSCTNILNKFFKIKWGYEPIKIKHLNIQLGKILKNKKNVTKYNKYLITLIHVNPKLNKKDLLIHLLKNKFKF